ncbi:helix-turn-helix transcriptional regulator [Pseudorhodoferax sp.]|uniref:helix-turn-helix transcriptional regulator n=1 Tax=Pseudorhodoferax sp. TaxID=1993553 RepID=UPI002DD6AEE1|nr:helix-turn-helix domain-containing protein [Pseudorhodoferax sp.]
MDDQEALPADGLAQMLDAIDVAVLLLTSQGRLVFANLAGQRALQANDCLSTRRGQLLASVAGQAQALERALAQARAGKRSMLQLGEGAGRRMMGLVPLPSQPAHAGDPYIMLISGRVSPTEPMSLLLFARVAGLTDGERDVLENLCKGLLAQEIASKRAVKITTVRTQIGSLRSKVGARTICELVAHATTLPPLAGRLVA